MRLNIFRRNARNVLEPTGSVTEDVPLVAVVDSSTAVSRPNADKVLWLDNSDNAVDGDLRVIDL